MSEERRRDAEEFSPVRHDYTPRAVGPEAEISGDPVWILPQIRTGGAYPGDRFHVRGRWKQRIWPTGTHPADWNHYMVGRVGLLQAWQRLYEALGRAEKTMTSTDVSGASSNPHDDPIAQAMVAAYEAMEWIHSLDEHLLKDGRYQTASDLDQIAGAIVEGVIAARNASHHGLRRVVGVARVPDTVYVALADLRWELTDRSDTASGFLSIRWLQGIPSRAELGIDANEAVLRSKRQHQAYLDHLAGREVRSTIGVAAGFMLYTVSGRLAPASIENPADHPPHISPDAPPVEALESSPWPRRAAE